MRLPALLRVLRTLNKAPSRTIQTRNHIVRVPAIMRVLWFGTYPHYRGHPTVLVAGEHWLLNTPEQPQLVSLFLSSKRKQGLPNDLSDTTGCSYDETVLRTGDRTLFSASTDLRLRGTYNPLDISGGGKKEQEK